MSSNEIPIVFATDCDRTLTGLDLVPDPDALAAITELRSRGIRCVLVTGRSKAELAVHPGVAAAFDGYALEGGATWGSWNDLWTPDNLDIALAAAARLEQAGVIVQRRTASFSCSIADLDAVLRLASDCSIQRNVDRLDVVPPRLDKGTGLDGVLSMGAIRGAHIIAIGDGENDIPLFERATVGLAVANAVPALKAVADEVLDAPGPAGVIDAARRILKGDWAPLPSPST